MVRKHDKPLEQVVWRYDDQIKNLIVESTSEQHNRNLFFNYENNNGPLLETACGPQYLKITLNTKMILNIRNSSVYSSVYVLTKAMEVVKIINIAHCILTKEHIIIGYYYKNKESFYDKPINSEKLDIYIVSNLSNNLKCWKITDIHKKMMLFSYENQQVTFPILHSEC